MRILYSSNRNALRARCLSEVCELTAVWPDKRAILLVPEQTKMDVERDYLEMSGQSGLMMAEVLSFRRLAWRLLGEIGQTPEQAVDSTGQGMLIHRVLKKNQPELHSFGHLADQPGFIRQAAAALGDLKRYQVEADRLLAAGESSDDRALRNKTHDLGILLREYDHALTETGLSDAEDDLNRLGAALQTLAAMPAHDRVWPWNRLEWLGCTSIWVSGFGETRDFTPQEDAILLALNRLTASLTLTIAVDHLPYDRNAIDHGADCFLAGRRTAWRLQQILPASRIERLPDPAAGMAARISTAIQEGRRCLPDPDPDVRAAESHYLRLIRADGRDSETAWVAGEVRRLVQTEGYRYRDITLAVCDLPGYTPLLRATCREYGIPLFVDAERPLTGTPLLRLVLGLLDVGLRNWTRDAVMTCLRSGLTDLDLSEIDRLENEMLARGVTRPDQLADDRRFPSPGLAAIRDRAFRPWQMVLAELNRMPAGDGKCRILWQFLRDYGLPERISRRSAQLAESGENEAALALVQSWNELDRLLDQLIRLTADTPMSLQVFRDTLAAGMEAAGSGSIPTAIDQVGVGDLRRAMLRQSRVLFLIGAAATALPPGLPPEGLLKDQDRQALSGLLNRQLPSSARDQAFADAFVIHALLTQPTDRLCLTAPDAAVSTWFNWLAAAAGPAAVQVLPPRPAWPDARLHALRPAFGYLLGHCGRQAVQPADGSITADREWRRLAAILAEAGLPLDQALTWLRQNADPGQIWQVRLPAGLVRSLYADPLVMSVSQLETYASCPFLHLAAYLLALRERPVWQPEAAETGTLLHGIVELALAELRQALAGLEPGDMAARRDLLEHWLAEDLNGRTSAWMRTAAEQEDLAMFYDAGLRASAGHRVLRLATASLAAVLRQYQAEAYRPAGLEWTFGPREGNQLRLSLPGGESLVFQGKIDRIDQTDGSGDALFRIIDYKSGNKKAEYDALYHGLALQLPIYLEAYSLACPDRRAADAAYFHFDRPILTVADGIRPTPEQMRQNLAKRYALRGLKLTPEQLVLLRRYSLEQAARLAGCLLAGDFAVTPRRLPGKKPACEYCLFQAVCGFDNRPSGYRWLPALAARPASGCPDARPAGRLSARRNPLADFLSEQYAAGGDPHAAHT